MPRYFFHVQDGVSMPDIEGTLLPDLAAAREEAVRYSGALLMDSAKEFWGGEQWFMEVHDEGDKVLFTLAFTATDGARRMISSKLAGA